MSVPDAAISRMLAALVVQIERASPFLGIVRGIPGLVSQPDGALCGDDLFDPSSDFCEVFLSPCHSWIPLRASWDGTWDWLSVTRT